MGGSSGHESVSVKEVMEEGGISVVFQPLVSLHDQPMRVFAYETLVRSPAFPSPPALIHAAIEQNQIGELGKLIRKLAVSTCTDHPLFLNIDPNEFDDGFLVRPDDPMFSHADEIYLEVTESVPLSHYEQCHSVLNEIRRRGIRIVVDDLGAGYSNLKYIADLAPHVVKLDRQLVSELKEGSRHHLLVTYIVDLCKGLGARVVAEGVETITEYHAVRSAGVHYAQGWFFARPENPPPRIDPEAIVREAS